MFQDEEIYILAIAVLAGVLIAATNVGPVGTTSLFVIYVYWVVRIFFEAGLFLAFRTVIDKLVPARTGFAISTASAIALSLVPFVLAITALDLVLGFPELGIETGAGKPGSRVSEFGMELVYLSDNHVALCLLLSVPRLMLRLGFGKSTTEHAEAPASAGSFVSNLEPPLLGELQWVEAQEHYVKLVSAEENRMVLHRFSDIVRELPAEKGTQVHRSHWVAFSAIKETFKDGTNLRLRLHSGETVPVSRSHRNELIRALELQA